VTIEIAVFFAGSPRCLRIIMYLVNGRGRAAGGIELPAAPILSGRRSVRVSARSMEPAANLTWLSMLICRSRATFGRERVGLGRDNDGVCASIW
jgi:hypothetical protein